MHRVIYRAAVSGVLAAVWLGSPRPASADTPNELFVERAHHDLLGRLPDSGELATESAGLDHGTLTPLDFANLLTTSAEFHGDEVRQQYDALLHRDPNPAEFNSWVQSMGGGLTVEQLQSTVAGSAEYYGDHSSSVTGFLGAVYPDLLGRSPTNFELIDDANALSQGETRANLASTILASNEYDYHLVGADYVRFLRRSADPASVFFVNELQQGARDETVIAQIVGSAEYVNRQPQPGDTNFDQSVNFTDLLTLAQHYGQGNAHWFDSDFNNDQSVGFDDLLALAQNYSRGAAIAAVPEPGISALLLSLAFACPRRRRV